MVVVVVLVVVDVELVDGGESVEMLVEAVVEVGCRWG